MAVDFQLDGVHRQNKSNFEIPIQIHQNKEDYHETLYN